MSTESERAEYYESHKDDPDVWGEPLPTRPRRRLASMISVRLSPDEAEAIRAAAEARGMSVSAFLRMAALKESGQDGPRPRVSLARRVQGIPANCNMANVAVTVVSAVRPQDIDKMGGTGLSALSAADRYSRP